MSKKKMPELSIERINQKANLMFISLLEYRKMEYLCVIDNISPTEIGAYVLDYAEQEQIPLNQFLSVAIEWFYAKSDNHPLSVEVARRGLTRALAPIYKVFDISGVTRVIGQDFSYGHNTKTKVKRRRVSVIPECVEIRFRRAG